MFTCSTVNRGKNMSVSDRVNWRPISAAMKYVYTDSVTTCNRATS